MPNAMKRAIFAQQAAKNKLLRKKGKAKVKVTPKRKKQ